MVEDWGRTASSSAAWIGGEQCISNCRERLHHGSIMTSTPSTRRRLDGVPSLATHWLIYAQAEGRHGQHQTFCLSGVVLP